MTERRGNVVLAAVDTSPCARPVLEAARGLADLLHVPSVRGVHVRQGMDQVLVDLAARSGIPVSLVADPVDDALDRALGATDVAAGVIGARSFQGSRRPVGHHTRHVLERATKPVLVVPPEIPSLTRHPFRRLLVPLDGTPDTSQPVIEALSPVAQQVEIVVLHVFTEDTMPRTLDHAEWDLPVWGKEFLARFLPAAARVELRVGPVGGRITELRSDEGSDLVVLSWSGRVGEDQGEVVTDVLGRAEVPVLVLPRSGQPDLPS